MWQKQKIEIKFQTSIYENEQQAYLYFREFCILEISVIFKVVSFKEFKCRGQKNTFREYHVRNPISIFLSLKYFQGFLCDIPSVKVSVGMNIYSSRLTFLRKDSCSYMVTYLAKRTNSSTAF